MEYTLLKKPNAPPPPTPRAYPPVNPPPGYSIVKSSYACVQVVESVLFVNLNFLHSAHK